MAGATGFHFGWILMKPQNKSRVIEERRTILKTDEAAKRNNLGVTVPGPMGRMETVNKRRRLMRRQQLEDVPELIQQIQSLLPADQAARTCVVSKSCLHAFSTTPTLRVASFLLKLNKMETMEKKTGEAYWPHLKSGEIRNQDGKLETLASSSIKVCLKNVSEVQT
ncbi:hypothetical protein Tco_0664961 [Tanacetum coccineum]